MTNLKLFMAALVMLLAVSGAAQTEFSAADWRSDLEELRIRLPQNHPDLFRQYSRQVFEKDLAALTAGLEGRSSMDIALDLQAILSKAGDSQTRLEMNPLLMKQRVIPVGFGWYAGGLYISGTIKRFQAAIGTRVLQINGVNTEAALEKLGRFVARENEFSLRKEAPQWLRFPAVFQKAGLGASDTLQLLLEDAQGRKAVLPVYPIDTKNGDPTELQPVQLKRTSADLRWQPARNIYWVHWLPEEKIAYLLYNNCLSREMALEEGDSVMAQQLPTFNYFADSLITLLQQNPGARVLIDLRFNPGGGASDGIRLARRLAEMPEVNRPDRLFVAVNMYTALAAVEVAEYFNDHTAALLLGDPPAQRPGHTGKVLPLPLPATGLEVRYSDEFPPPDKKEPTVLRPDVLIEMTFPAFRQGRDPVMDYVRKGF